MYQIIKKKNKVPPGPIGEPGLRPLGDGNLPGLRPLGEPGLGPSPGEPGLGPLGEGPVKKSLIFHVNTRYVFICLGR